MLHSAVGRVRARAGMSTVTPPLILQRRLGALDLGDGRLPSAGV